MKTTSNYLLPIILLLLSIAGFLTVIYGSKWGIGMGPDSVTYLKVALNLLTGHGFSVPTVDSPASVTNYPPLYPAAIAASTLFGLEPLMGARWLAALLLSANILLVGIILLNCTTSTWAAAAGSFFTLTAINILQVHFTAGTEALFLFFALCGILFLGRYLENYRIFPFVVSSVSISLACLTTYAGTALVLSAAVSILYLSKKPWRKRVVASLLFLGITVFPLLLWIVRNVRLSQDVTESEIVFHPVGLSHFQQLMETVSTWLLPERIPTYIRYPILIMFIVLIMAVFFHSFKNDKIRNNLRNEPLFLLPIALLFFTIVYGILLITSISFYVASTPLDYRILSPLYLSILIIVVFIFSRAKEFFARNFILKCVLPLACIIIATSFAGASTIFAYTNHTRGRGYMSEKYRLAKVLSQIKRLSREMRIFSNAPDLIYLYTDRLTHPLSPLYCSYTTLDNTEFAAEMDIMRKELLEGRGVLVYFSSHSWRSYYPTEDSLVRNFDLSPILHDSIATLYIANEASKSTYAYKTARLFD